MTIATEVCNSYKTEIMKGVHEDTDTYKMALYTSAATLGKATTAYSATNESSGTGYVAGGVTLTGFSATLSGDTAMLDFNDPAWPGSTITARGCLIYNASKGNKAIASFDFGGDVSSTAGTLTVELPVAGASTALVRVT